MDYTNMDEGQLLKLAKQGDTLALGELVWSRGITPGMKTVARRKLWDSPHLAEEVIQNTAETACKKVGQFRGDSKFSTFVWAIFRNKIRETIRSERKGKTPPDDGKRHAGDTYQQERVYNFSEKGDKEVSHELVSPPAGPADWLSYEQTQVLVDKIISENFKSDKAKHAIAIAIADSHITQREIAKKVGLSDGSVSEILKKFKDVMRQVFFNVDE